MRLGVESASAPAQLSVGRPLMIFSEQVHPYSQRGRSEAAHHIVHGHEIVGRVIKVGGDQVKGLGEQLLTL